MDKKLVRISEAAAMLGVTAQTLRNWEKTGRLRAERSSGGQRYYAVADLKRLIINLAELGWSWAASAQAPELPDEYYCERPDRFSSRLEKMAIALEAALGSDETDNVSLLTQVAGEIGDNSFAHNIGNWPDIPGVFFAYDAISRLIVLADRGQGVRATLRRVRPEIENDIEALRIAFTEVISGRDPEKRGNGLKVVRSVAEQYSIGLKFRSGLGTVTVPKEPGVMRIAQAKENVRGAYAIITF
ncbi:MAG: MerR family DNA-binding transcriptional regulator [Candidatus Kerfeldbacteria bacterium]|nr:MerR family DNA-binding transcriptional regulator [Candidatus Kerfeldbacteria bacterium]